MNHENSQPASQPAMQMYGYRYTIRTVVHALGRSDTSQVEKRTINHGHCCYYIYMVDSSSGMVERNAVRELGGSI
jgi:hypothetical protein